MRKPDLSIASWLGLGFAMAAGLLAVVVVVALVLQARIGEHAARQLELIGPRSTSATKLESAVLRVGISARGYVLAPDEGRRRSFEESTARLDQALAAFARLPKDPDGVTLAAEILAAAKPFHAAAMALAELGLQGRGGPERGADFEQREAVLTASREALLQRITAYQALQDRKDVAASTAILSHRRGTDRTLVVAFLVVLALLGATAAVVTSEVRRPVRRLVHATRRMAHGDYGAGRALGDAVPPGHAPARSELAELSLAFWSMAETLREREERIAAQNEELQAQQEELQSQNEELQAQQEELQAQQEELQSQNEELRRQSDTLRDREGRLDELVAALRTTDRRKDEFLAVLAHELRNPLAPIVNALHVLSLEGPGGDASQRAHRIASRQVAHLSRLVDDLLDVARITSGKIHLRRERIDLGQCVRQAVEDNASLLAERGLKIELREPDRRMWVDADPARLSQVVGNLLQNAAKFTNSGGTVRVVVDASAKERATIRVRDDGVGMTADVLERLFEPFVQAEASLARTRGGLGLGLALVKGLVELHGGSIRASSEGNGKGSEFTIELPLAEARHDLGARDAVLRDGAPRDGVPRNGAPRDGEHRDRGQGVAAVPARRVLIVEDNVDAAETLRSLLQLSGHHAEVAFDYSQGLEKARAMVPDVILCDIGLPDVDGYELGRRVREDPVLRSVLLVAISGYARPEDVARSAAAGFDAHLAKPAAIEAIKALLARSPASPPVAQPPVDASSPRAS